MIMTLKATDEQLALHKDELLKAALYYASIGWHVIPLHFATKDQENENRCSCRSIECANIGKHPKITNWPDKATTDEKQIRQWWKLWPLANVGIVCGEKSNLFVFDIDGETGQNSIKGKEIPITVTSETGNGFQLFFQHPKDSAIKTKNTVGILLKCDIRTNGGYVVAPPSVHRFGVKYQWLRNPSEFSLAEVPQLILDKFKENDTKKEPVQEHLQFYKNEANTNKANFPNVKKHVANIINAELKKVRNSKDGNRNSTLNKASYFLGRICAGNNGIVDIDQIKQLLFEAAPIAENFKEYEVNTLIKRGIDAGGKDPLTVQEAEPRHPLTDYGNAMRFIEQHHLDVRYVAPFGGWLLWNDKHWELDKIEIVRKLAHKTALSIYDEVAEAGKAGFRDLADDLEKWAKTSQSSARIEAMLKEARAYIGAKPSDFDNNDMLFNCSNGTLHFEQNTVVRKNHSREDMLTKIAPIEYNENADCPTWLNFLNKIFAGNTNLINYLQCAIGYTLTGNIQHHALFFCYGTGSNGKSTLFNTIAALLGEYSRKCAFDTLLEKNKVNSGASSPDIARLAGSRFVFASEPDAGKRFNESMLKDLTGGEEITARHLYQDEFQFKPLFKLWIAANHKPEIKGQDLGIWRRIKMIPFEVTIQDHEKDYTLEEKLKSELSGILNWSIQGYLKWQQEGLVTPIEVVDATEAYKVESDILAEFLNDLTTKDKRNNVLVSNMYQAYFGYAKGNLEDPMKKRTFIKAMDERGFKTYTGTANKLYFSGVSLILSDITSQQAASKKAS